MLQNVLNNFDIKKNSIEKFELLLLKLNLTRINKLPVTTAFRLVIFYILSFPDFKKLEKTFFYSLFNFKHFIAMNAELFFFNGKLETLIEEFLLFKNTDHSNITDIYFEKYMETIILLSGDIIIDDIIANALVYLDFSKQVIKFKSVRFVNYGDIYKPMCLNTDISKILVWIEYIILHKDISRFMLRMIFNRIIYLDFDQRTVIYRILKQIIRLYKISDDFIKEYNEKKYEEYTTKCELSETHNECKDCLEEIKSKLVQKQSKSKNTFEELKSTLFETHNDFKDSLFKKNTELEIKNQKSELCKNIKHFKNKRLYEDSIDKKEYIGKDNVYVLTNLIWEDIVYYLINLNKLEINEQKEIVELVTTMIQKTDLFLKQRVMGCKEFIENIKYNKKMLDAAISVNFKNKKL